MSIRIGDIVIHPKHPSTYHIVFVLFGTPSKETSRGVLPFDHPLRHVLARLDDILAQTSTCSSTLVWQHISSCLCYQLIVISASVLMTTRAPHGKMVLSLPP